MAETRKVRKPKTDPPAAEKLPEPESWPGLVWRLLVKNPNVLVPVAVAAGLAAVFGLGTGLIPMPFGLGGDRPPAPKAAAPAGVGPVSQGDNSQATVVNGVNAGRDVTINQGGDTSALKAVVERGLPQDEHPVIDLGEPMERQVRLFPEDRVRVHVSPSAVREVWFGHDWEPYEPDRTYLVWGYRGVPVTPKFRGPDVGGYHAKLEITYTRYRDQPRTLHGGRPDRDGRDEPKP